MTAPRWRTSFNHNGSPTTYKTGPTTNVNLTFDPEFRMTWYGGTQFTAAYRGDGLRGWKNGASGTTYFVYDGGAPLLELNASGTVLAVNTFGANGLVSRRVPAGSPANVYYTFDPQGSVCQRLDANAAVLSTHFFDAFGMWAASAPTVGPFGYGGQCGYYTDGETGLLLLTNRYYDVAKGRFVTRDPIGYAGGMNLYAYVGNGPLTASDPLGLCEGDDGIDAIKAGYRNFWKGVNTIAGYLKEGTEFLAGFNPVTSVGVGANKFGEGKYLEGGTYLLGSLHVGGFGGVVRKKPKNVSKRVGGDRVQICSGRSLPACARFLRRPA